MRLVAGKQGVVGSWRREGGGRKEAVAVLWRMMATFSPTVPVNSEEEESVSGEGNENNLIDVDNSVGNYQDRYQDEEEDEQETRNTRERFFGGDSVGGGSKSSAGDASEDSSNRVSLLVRNVGSKTT